MAVRTGVRAHSQPLDHPRDEEVQHLPVLLGARPRAFCAGLTETQVKSRLHAVGVVDDVAVIDPLHVLQGAMDHLRHRWPQLAPVGAEHPDARSGKHERGGRERRGGGDVEGKEGDCARM